jgi:hypothetical protein
MPNHVSKDENMSDQLPPDEFRPVTVESHLSKLMEVWQGLLTPVEFKIAACLYRLIEQNGGRDVRISGRVLAKGAGVGERSVDAARKTLAANGIFRVQISPQGSSFGLPRASPISKTSGPECPVTETATESAPAPAAAQDSGPTAIAGLDIQAPTAAARNTEALVPAAPGLQPPEGAAESTPQEEASGPAIDAAVISIASTPAAGSARIAEPDIALERSAGTPPDRLSADTAPIPAPAAAVIAVLQKLQCRVLQALQTVRAYLLKEDFQQFWEYDSPTWAGKFLDFWCHHTMRSRIEPMKKIARMLRAHRELLLNYFKAKKQFSSGVVEGLNNKAKVTMRRSYGFRTFRILELALYHSLGKLPEPEVTHEFF